MLAEYQFDRDRLDLVIELGRGAVKVDVIYGGRFGACVLKRHGHRPSRLDSAVVQPHPLIGIWGGSVSGYLGV